MPTYEYHCLKCGRDFEATQSIKADPLTECILEGCRGPVKRRIGTGAGIIFKGSGFYETDYKRRNGNGVSDKSKSHSKSESKSDSAGASASAAKTESNTSSPAASAASAPGPKPAAD